MVTCDKRLNDHYQDSHLFDALQPGGTGHGTTAAGWEMGAGYFWLCSSPHASNWASPDPGRSTIFEDLFKTFILVQATTSTTTQSISDASIEIISSERE